MYGEHFAILAAVLSVLAVGISASSALSLRKTRKNVARSLTESANQQVRTAQRLFNALAQIQKTQQGYDQQLQELLQANAHLRHGLANISTRLEHARYLSGDLPQQRPTIH